MDSVYSIIIIKKDNKYLNYFDENWGIYLFPNIKGNNIDFFKNLLPIAVLVLSKILINVFFLFWNLKVSNNSKFFLEAKSIFK